MNVDLTPARLDLKLYAGDGEAVAFEIVAAGVPVDVSDRAWQAQWRPARESDTAVDLTVDDTDAATGIVVVHFTAAVTRTLAAVGVWDLQATIAGGEPETLVHGQVDMTTDVTR